MAKPLPWTYDDGGRKAAGYRGDAGDCVARAWAIVLERPYSEVYEDLAGRNFDHWNAKAQRKSKHQATYERRAVRSARNGIPTEVIHAFAEENGFHWVATMGFGQGTTHHLTPGEIPVDRAVVRVSKHVTAILDGVVHDTYDPSRHGTRAVYGYWTPKESA